MSGGLHDDERRILDLLAEVWNIHIRMWGEPVGEDYRRLAAAIHEIQGIIALRVARRIDPDVWRAQP